MNAPEIPVPSLPTEVSTPVTPIVLWIGLDWADTKHHVVARPPTGSARHEQELLQRPECIEQWLLQLRQQYPTGQFGLCLEQKNGPAVVAFLKFDFVQIFPVNPRTLSEFRSAFALSGAKSDPSDADYLVELGLKHSERLTPLKPQDPLTRQLAQLNELRRTSVDDRTALVNRLIAALKGYYPLAHSLFAEALSTPIAWAFLRRWPTLAALQRATPAQVRKFFYAHHSRSEELIEQRLKAIAEAKPLTEDPAILEVRQLQVQGLCRQLTAVQQVVADYDQRIAQLFPQHPYAPLFASLPGAGAALAPRLAVLFGTLPDNWPAAQNLLCFTGVAPVTRQSGRQRTTHFRRVRPKFIHQTVVEFAKCSLPKCQWAQQLYQSLTERGMGRWQAIRVVAFKWIRILWRCWRDNSLYDETRYLRSLQKRGLKLYESLYQTLPSSP